VAYQEQKRDDERHIKSLFAPVTPVFPTSYLVFILPKTTKMQIMILLLPQLLVHLIHARHIRASEKLELLLWAHVPWTDALRNSHEQLYHRFGVLS
jgi:hypothetical protein